MAGKRTASIAVAVSFFLLFGCGGRTDEARQYVERADQLHAESDKTAIGTRETRRALVKAFVENDVGGLLAREGEVQILLQGLDKLSSQLDRAVTAYKKVDSLEDAEEYKKYAELKLEAISKEKEMLALGKSMALNVASFIADIKAGKQFDLQQLVRDATRNITRLDKYEDEVAALERKARIYARQNDLFD